mgnify:CR=1 FL=1
MTIIFKNNNVTLKKLKQKNHYELKTDWEKNIKAFWVNFPFPYLKIIDEKINNKNKDSDKKEKKQEEIKTYKIYAESIVPLKEWVKKNKEDYTNAIRLLYDIGNQLQSLEGFSLAVPFLSIDDIIVVNNNDSIHFLYLNDEKVYNFNIKEEITVDKLHKKSKYLSPEIKKENKLPMTIHYKSGLYSLASMVSHILLSTEITKENKDKVLHKINTTKLFWSLKRMLETNPEERYYLII